MAEAKILANTGATASILAYATRMTCNTALGPGREDQAHACSSKSQHSTNQYLLGTKGACNVPKERSALPTEAFARLGWCDW